MRHGGQREGGCSIVDVMIKKKMVRQVGREPGQQRMSELSEGSDQLC